MLLLFFCSRQANPLLNDKVGARHRLASRCRARQVTRKERRHSIERRRDSFTSRSGKLLCMIASHVFNGPFAWGKRPHAICAVFPRAIHCLFDVRRPYETKRGLLGGRCVNCNRIFLLFSNPWSYVTSVPRLLLSRSRHNILD